MSRIGASLLLCFTVGLLSATHAQAEVWRCHQTGGPDLFTNWLQDPHACQKYEVSADLNFVPRYSTTTLPDFTPYPPMPVPHPRAPPVPSHQIPDRATAAAA